MNKKTILIYGDSNTWGMTDKMTRYPFRVRWTSQLQKLLGDSYEVIGAGVPGGVAGDYPNANLIKRRRGTFDLVYRRHRPVDILIIALGTNDLRHEYSRAPEQTRDDLLWYRDRMREINGEAEREESTKLLYLLPSNFDLNLFPASVEKRLELIKLMKQVDNPTISADEIDLSSDGAHFSELGHEQMSKIVFSKIKELEND
ncbi:hypothetical protein EOM60_01845 [Candidatus Saccharibacteria bacterium]|nr:hypothetical protein [Candidatus Saccharibacteria bacterium]